MTKRMTMLATVALAVAGAGTAASAQDWKAAVAAGSVGEQADGYLGVVGGGAGLAAMVGDVNIKRKGAYTAQATAEGTTVEAAGISGGCSQIKRLGAGQKYRGPDGGWHTVGQGALELDARCPR